MLKIRAGIVTGVVAVLLMAGCSSTPTKEQEAAKVEDRQPMTPQTTITVKPPVSVETQPVTPGRIDPPTQLSGPAMLRDPNNILSKRIIYFDFDSNLVREEFRPLVAAHAKYITQDSNARMIIQGNTDERGSREYNLALGQRRADAVKQMMTVLGADAARVETVSFGEEKPRVDGATEAAFTENRRAEIVYRGE
jgi:peptidoglycan-associated lipoprotein